MLLCGTEHGAGVSVAWSCWEPSCAPAATATVDRGWKGGRAACVSDGAVRATLLCRCGWEGVGAVACPTGQTRPTLFGVGDLRRARKPDDAGSLAHGRYLGGGFRGGGQHDSPLGDSRERPGASHCPGRCKEPARARISHRILPAHRGKTPVASRQLESISWPYSDRVHWRRGISLQVLVVSI